MSKDFWKNELQSDLVLENYYRLVGRKIAIILAKTRINPNTITIARIPLGLFIFYLLAYTDKYIVVLSLIVLWKVVDKVDGAYARYTKQITKLGGWLDMVIDRFFWGFTLLAITISVYKSVSDPIPWLLLFIIIFSHMLFQNFSFLNMGSSSINWSKKSKPIKKGFLYQIIFSIYYLNDQVVALALLLYYPLNTLFNLNSLYLTLVFFSLFYTTLMIWVLYVQSKHLLIRR